MAKIEFPKDFYWGSATSAHQVEGNTNNNWVAWEYKNAKRLAKEVKNKWEVWQQKQFPEMFDNKNYISGKAADHYNRYGEDFNIAKKLNHNAYRFSIEWSRIEPEKGKFNEAEIEHYRQVIMALKERGIEPFITLYHWTHPLWFEEKGAWLNKNASGYFERYAEKVVSEFKNEVKFWITINEPHVFASHSYLKGNWPPQSKSILQYFKVLKCLKNTHIQVYQKIKKVNNKAQVGIAKNNIYFEARGINKILKFFADRHWNFWFLNKIKNYQDFIGLNYYFHNKIADFKFNQNENKKISDLGWEIYPQGIYYVLKDLKKYNKPIYITENGLADAKDEKRADFIKKYLSYTLQAIRDDVDVRGYFYWSLLDNFEWDKGFWPRFGLIEVDYKTMERKIRPSALEYAEIIKNNGLSTDA